MLMVYESLYIKGGKVRPQHWAWQAQ